VINVLVPMAGEGSRFAKAGYEKPKPFIDVLGKPMISRVLENLKIDGARYILIVRKEHIDAEPEIVRIISEHYPVDWVVIDKLTEGTASTILHARRLISNSTPLLIANSDQIVDGGVGSMLQNAVASRLDGSILCFVDRAMDTKWSFAKLNDSNFVIEVREKEAISNLATVGIYYFEKGADFVNGAIDMIVRNERVNGEFYTCPVYNYLIQEGKKIGVHIIHPDAMHGLGTPDDLKHYIKLMNADLTSK
jgi:UDP-N-acetylglucosamine diphosphorylase / glucose-1-phosphate thymidylyltransferase / UDP-N-acetylgalactosamine diphosphorylase / glucosamine-1-phosphate N-acetyltransferase / galactosamine-1-phosphate N-acetyltransferase